MKSVEAARPERIVLALAFVLCFVLYGLAAAPVELFERTQNSYFPHGMRWAGREFLAHDWFANTIPLHVVFSFCVAAADRLGVLDAATAVMAQGVGAALLAGVVLIAFSLRRSGEADTTGALAALVAVVVYVLLAKGIIVPEWLRGEPATGGPVAAIDVARDLFSFRGMAEQSIHSERLDPASFGSFALLGTGLLGLRRWRLAAASFAIASLFHASYLPHTTLAVCVLCTWLWRAEERREAMLCALIFGLPSLPVAMYGAGVALSATQAPEAMERLARERVPHHALPRQWWDAGEWLRLLVLLAGASVIWRRTRGPMRGAAVASLVLSLGAVAWVAAADAARLGLGFPWRATTWLFPIALAALLQVIVGEPVARLAGARPALRLATALSIAALLVVACLRFVVVPPAPTPRLVALDRVADRAREATEPDATLLVPARRRFRDFRLRAERAIYVDYTSHPFVASEVAEWHARVAFARAFQEAPVDRRVQLCRRVEVDYYVLPSSSVVSAVEEVVLRTDGFALLRCPVDSASS